jgi:hypothetical protein
MMFVGRRMRLAMRKRGAAQTVILKRMPRFKPAITAPHALPGRSGANHAHHSVAGRRHALER